MSATLLRLQAAAIKHRLSPTQENLHALIAAADTYAEWHRTNEELLRQSQFLARYHQPSLSREIDRHLKYGYTAEL